MPIIRTHEVDPTTLEKFQRDQVYNGLDNAVTWEVFSKISKLYNQEPEPYSFTRAIQAPALEMMLRGWKVDLYERDKRVAELTAELAQLYDILDEYAAAVWDRPPRMAKAAGRLLRLNPASRSDMLAFFCSIKENKDKSITKLDEGMGLPAVRTSKKGEKKLSMDREALEKIEQYFYAMPIVAVVLAIRETAKQREQLLTEVEADGRMRTSYNIVGAETGRWSSSTNAWGTGGNLQNVNPQLRAIFEADPGWKLAGMDLEQAEAREVGFKIGTLFDDWTYLDGCEKGDLHTTTAKLIWPNLAWTGDAKRDRELAEQPFYRHFSYRDMSKRGGHGTSYYGTPFTMARHLKVPIRMMEEFQAKFLGQAYPGISKWHRWVAEQLQTVQFMTTRFGFTRHFFGRPNDDSTLREAIAFEPQSNTAYCTNLGLWRLWKHLHPRIILLHQNHDAVYFMYREEEELEILPLALKLMRVRVEFQGRAFEVPTDCAVGWNWGKHHDESKPTPGWTDKNGTWHSNPYNPNGLKKWKGQRDERKRLSGLARPL